MSWLLNHPIGDRWNETVRHYAEMYEKEVLKGSLNKDKLLDISAVLVRSNCSAYIKTAIDILEQLSTTVHSNTTYKTYLIYLSIGYIRIRSYDLAHNCLKYLKSIEPNSRQGLELEECLQKNRLNDRFKDSVSTITASEDKEVEELKQYLNSTADYANQTF